MRDRGLNARSSKCAIERYPFVGPKNPVPRARFFFAAHSIRIPLCSWHQEGANPLRCSVARPAFGPIFAWAKQSPRFLGRLPALAAKLVRFNPNVSEPPVCPMLRRG